MPANFVESVATYLPVIIILIASVLIMVIPQRKKDKKFKEMLEGLKFLYGIGEHSDGIGVSKKGDEIAEFLLILFGFIGFFESRKIRTVRYTGDVICLHGIHPFLE